MSDDLPIFHVSPQSIRATAGIYCIRNAVTGRRYVGSSHNCRSRGLGHASHLVRGRHANRYLQADWTLLGAGAFEWAFLEAEDDPKERVRKEAVWILSLEADYDDGGYNLVRNPSTGVQSQSVRDGMSAARKGRPAWNKGIPCPEHVKQANSRAHTGRVKTAAEIEKLRAAMLGPSHPHRGKSLGPETRAKLSARVRRAAALTGEFKGVNRDARTGSYSARIYVAGKQLFLGRYPTAMEAAQAYNVAAIQHYGPGCYLNSVRPGSPTRRTTLGRPAREAAHV